MSVGALVAWTAGGHVLAIVCVAGMTVAASLESFLGYCLGCKIFGLLMRWGVIPETVCESCNDISGRLAAASLRLAETQAPQFPELQAVESVGSATR